MNFTTYSKILLFVFWVLLSNFSSLAQKDKIELGKKMSGKASYYHKHFSGRKTASGERLNNQDYTCAHPSLPFGTLLEVSNPVNKKWVVVRVNDRGPFSKGRILDLSFAAAVQIGMIHKGVINVEAKVVGQNGELCILREDALAENLRNIFSGDTIPKVNIPYLPISNSTTQPKY
jgi:rare lipoprotein A